jgi:WD40 repeat protein
MNTKRIITGAALVVVGIVPAALSPAGSAVVQQDDGPRKLAEPFQHDRPITFVGFMAEGKQLVTASQDGNFRVWESATGKEVGRFGKEQKVDPASKVPPSILALARDGGTLAVAGHDGTIHLWETGTGKEVRLLGTPQAGKESSQPVSLRFSPDARLLAVRGPDHVIRLFAVHTGNELRQLGKGPGPGLPRRIHFAYGPHCDNSLAFSPDGKRLIAVDVEVQNQQQVGIVRVWESETGKEQEQLKIEQNNPFFDSRTGFGVAALAFPQDRKVLLAWASSDGTSRLYEPTADKEPRRLVAVQQGVHVAFVFSTDGKILAARASNSPAIRLYETASGRSVLIANESANPAASASFSSQQLAFSPDGKVLAGALGHTVGLWNVADGKRLPPAAQAPKGR